ncbi:MAG TPA: alanine racemase [Dissulfurispiraceae bacterium]|nr:alanine racemase [Dissulfurispiraceae bacterium]
MQRGVTAEIDLGAVSANLSAVRSISGNRKIMAVVKADAYGHGAVDVSRALVQSGADCLAVAFTAEAAVLREAGIVAPIIVLFDPDIEDVLEYELIPVLSDMKSARAFAREAEKRGKRITVHVKVDTGMGRLGLFSQPAKDILEIATYSGIRVGGIMSHLSEADLADPAFALQQIAALSLLRAELLQNGLDIKLFHIANSASVIGIPESLFDAVRPGIMLYGYSPLQAARVASGVTLAPVMSIKARLISLRRLCTGTPISYARTYVTGRESLIGVMAVGYADGFNTRFSNNAEVLVRGKRAPVVGRVCMDLTMVDLTDIEGVTEDDEAVIIGRQGGDYIGADDLARRIQTIPYEILTSLGSRAKRRYL